VQHEVLSRIAELQRELGMSILFITHDMSIVSRFAARIGVLYAGELVELAPARNMFRSPLHPYTKGLFSSLAPVQGHRQRLMGIPGSPPDLLHRPTGCAFRTRCSQAAERCAIDTPSLRRLDEDRSVACHFVST
jgi:peptide/nickel transport system ATP-binding protein